MKKIAIILIVISINIWLMGCADNAVKDTSANLTETSESIQFDFEILTENLSQIMIENSDNEKKALLGDVKVLSGDEVSRILQIDTNLFEEYYFAKHSDETKASLVMVLKPLSSDDEVKSEMNTFLDMYQKQFDSYFPAEVKIIEDCYSIDKGDYIIYTISDDNQAVINAINKSKK